MVQLYNRVSRSLALPISTMPRFIIPLADKLDSSIGGMPETFTRNSTATHIEDGLVKTAGIDVPRFQNGRYLCEPAATNRFLQSGAPATQAITVVSGTVYTVQCYGSGSITLSGAGTGSVVEGAPITFTASSTSLICTVSGSLNRAQVETGTKATSYIPTTTTTITRAADVLHYTVGDVITQGQGSLYCEFVGMTSFGVIKALLTLSDNTSNNRIYPHIAVDGKITLKGVVGGAYTPTRTGGTILSTLNKILVTYKAGETKLYFNGALVGTITASAVPASLTKLNAGSLQDGTYHLNSEIGNVRYFKEVLTPAEAIKLTTL